MSDDPAIKKKSNGDASARVAFDYIKSQHFRVIRADGAIGSVTPKGEIHFALFSERAAIPRRQVHEIQDSGLLGPPIAAETVSRDAVVREMDVDVFVSVDVAKVLVSWLQGQINEAEQLTIMRDRRKKETTQ